MTIWRTGEHCSMARRKKLKPDEMQEVFRRFQEANPNPEGELDSVNTFTFLVAVVLSAQATDEGVNRATRDLFKVADTPEKCLHWAKTRCATTSRPSGCSATRPRTSSPFQGPD
jgi:endonuclease-3